MYSGPTSGVSIRISVITGMRVQEPVPYRKSPANAGAPVKLKNIQIDANVARAIMVMAAFLLCDGMIRGNVSTAGTPARRGIEDRY